MHCHPTSIVILNSIVISKSIVILSEAKDLLLRGRMMRPATPNTRTPSVFFSAFQDVKVRST